MPLGQSVHPDLVSISFLGHLLPPHTLTCKPHRTSMHIQWEQAISVKILFILQRRNRFGFDGDLADVDAADTFAPGACDAAGYSFDRWPFSREACPTLLPLSV